MAETLRRFLNAGLLVLGLVEYWRAREVDGPRGLEHIVNAVFLVGLASVRL
ncbi:MAG: hypothetical protein ACPLRM_02475 [Anaerolineae bacterium]